MSADDKPLLVGEMNPYGSLPKYALFPYPEHSAGGRLCRKVLGMAPGAYLRETQRVNLCFERWSLPEARRAAADIQYRQGRVGFPIILLGAKVSKAFGFEYRPFWCDPAGGLCILPHPSGLCRIWNEPDAVGKAQCAVNTVAPGLLLLASDS